HRTLLVRTQIYFPVHRLPDGKWFTDTPVTALGEVNRLPRGTTQKASAAQHLRQLSRGHETVGRQPSGCSIRAVLRPRVEGDGPSRRASMDGVDNRLEEHKAFRRQADTSANDNAVVVCGGQLTFHRLHGHFIRTDEAQVTLPAPVFHLLQRKRNAGADL